MASAGRMIHHLDPFINVETEQWKLGSSVKMVPVGDNSIRSSNVRKMLPF
jgi:hypothetical protein